MRLLPAAGLIGTGLLLLFTLCNELDVLTLGDETAQGAGFVTLCDLASRLLFTPYELPVGILMSVIGGQVFLFLLVRHKGGHGQEAG